MDGRDLFKTFSPQNYVTKRPVGLERSHFIYWASATQYISLYKQVRLLTTQFTFVDLSERSNFLIKFDVKLLEVFDC